MKVIDLTSKLPNYDSIIFNPGLIKLSGDKYLIVYRVWIDSRGPRVHPWGNRQVPRSQISWDGIDNVGVAVITIDTINGKVKVIKSNLIQEDIEDTRLFKVGNTIRMLFTKFVTHPERIRALTSGTTPKPEQNISDPDSFMMYTSRINGYLEKDPGVLLCRGHTTNKEKNWVPIPGNKVLRFSYKNPGKMAVYKVTNYSKQDNCENKILTEYTVSGIKQMATLCRAIRFSGGSPAISFNATEYIAIGHIVVKTREELLPEYTKLKKYSNVHGAGLVYISYFYTISKQNYQVMRISNPFSFGNDAIEFSAGLVKDKGNFIISYGVDDCKVKVAIVPIKDIPLYPESELPKLKVLNLSSQGSKRTNSVRKVPKRIPKRKVPKRIPKRKIIKVPKRKIVKAPKRKI